MCIWKYVKENDLVAFKRNNSQNYVLSQKSVSQSMLYILVFST